MNSSCPHWDGLFSRTPRPVKSSRSIPGMLGSETLLPNASPALSRIYPGYFDPPVSMLFSCAPISPTQPSWENFSKLANGVDFGDEVLCPILFHPSPRL